MLRFRSQFFNVPLINVSTSTDNKVEGIKDGSYKHLHRKYKKLPQHDIKTVKVKVKQSRYRPKVAQRVPGS